MRVAESIVVRRPVEVVWDLVSDPRNDPRWCPKVNSVKAGDEGRWTVVHKPMPLRGESVLRVEQVESESPQRLKLREEDETSVFEVEYRLDPVTGGTRFTQVSDFQFKRMPRLLHPFLQAGVRRDVRRQLRALARLLEQDSEPDTPQRG